MVDEPVRIAMIVASTREGRMAPTVASWLAGQLASLQEIRLDTIDLAEEALPAVLSDRADSAVGALLSRLAAADGFVVVTPEYNHGYPAPLKSALDWSGTEWHGKPVAFVSYGGVSGGIRAVEQLRQVFPELHAMTVRDAVSFHQVWDVFDADGVPREEERYARSVAKMRDTLLWWARTLRSARVQQPFPV